jgi:hypothetical protein
MEDLLALRSYVVVIRSPESGGDGQNRNALQPAPSDAMRIPHFPGRVKGMRGKRIAKKASRVTSAGFTIPLK